MIYDLLIFVLRLVNLPILRTVATVYDYCTEYMLWMITPGSVSCRCCEKVGLTFRPCSC